MSSSSSLSSSATIIITGGGGFLGRCLASALVEKGAVVYDDSNNTNDEAAAVIVVPIGKMILADIAFPSTTPNLITNSSSSSSTIEIVQMQGDISDASFCEKLYANTSTSETFVSVFHLGAVMSGDGERDFDLCMRVNLHSCLHMLEGARQLYEQKKINQPSETKKKKSATTPSSVVKFIFCSAGATVGSGAPTDYIQKDDTISDACRATPHTTYGMTKACCELLLSDYARRCDELGVDARGLRLPTIVVRAGAPNAATTSCFSSVVREPLAGVNITDLPIARTVPHAVTGKRAAISAMLTLHNVSQQRIQQVLGFDRTVFLPSVALSLGDLEEALKNTVTPESLSKLGKIEYEVDAHLSEVVGSFPTKIDASRALKLGIPPAPNAETLVREYMQDFPAAIAKGIEMKVEAAAATVFPENTARVEQKVAVVTGGGSGIGQAFALRLSRGGWIVVLAGRRLKALQETQKQLLQTDGVTAECLCVPTDVTVEADVQNLFAATQRKYGRVDLLFNNAGVNTESTSVEDVALDEFEKVMQTNVRGPFLCAREAMRLMAQNGTGGRIINNGSLSAQVPRPGSICYTTSKHAVTGLTKCIALDGRRINVACGQIDLGNVVSELSMKTNKAGKGALQANGTHMVEPSMTLHDAAETLWAMANLPLEANILQATVMASGMPFVGRG